MGCLRIQNATLEAQLKIHNSDQFGPIESRCTGPKTRGISTSCPSPMSFMAVLLRVHEWRKSLVHKDINYKNLQNSPFPQDLRWLDQNLSKLWQNLYAESCCIFVDLKGSIAYSIQIGKKMARKNVTFHSGPHPFFAEEPGLPVLMGVETQTDGWFQHVSTRFNKLNIQVSNSKNNTCSKRLQQTCSYKSRFKSFQPIRLTSASLTIFLEKI